MPETLELKIETLFELYHLHGPEVVIDISKQMGITYEQLYKDIKMFEENLTEPYEIKGIMDGKEVIIATIGGRK